MSLHDGFDSASEALKVRHRPLFLAMQRANRAWTGGVTEGFKVMGVNPTATLAALAPDEYGQAPSLLLALEYIEYFKPREVVHYIAGLADCITLPSPSARKAYPSRQAAVDGLTKIMRTMLRELHEIDFTARATPLSLSRAQAIQADLLSLIDAAHVTLMKLSPVSQDVRVTLKPRSPMDDERGAAVHPDISTTEHVAPAHPPHAEQEGAPIGKMHKGSKSLDVSVGSGSVSN